MLTLILDTETTGLPNWKRPRKERAQPVIVEIGAVIVDHHWAEVASFSAIVRPDDWVIEPGATEIHGITQEYAQRHGLSLRSVCAMLQQMVHLADAVGSFNWPFDRALLETCYWRATRDLPTKVDFVESLGQRETICVMTESRKLMKPYIGSKTPKLDEVFQHLVGRPRAGRHRALQDAHDAITALRTIRERTPANTDAAPAEAVA